MLSIQNTIFSILFYFMYKTAHFILTMNQILLPLVNYMNIVDRAFIPSWNEFSKTFKKLQLWLNSQKSKTSLKHHSTNVLEVSKEIAGYVEHLRAIPTAVKHQVGDCRFQVSLGYRMGPCLKKHKGWRNFSVVVHLPSIKHAHNLIPSTANKKEIMEYLFSK